MPADRGDARQARASSSGTANLVDASALKPGGRGGTGRRRGLKIPRPLRPCGFDSHRPHQRRAPPVPDLPAARQSRTRRRRPATPGPRTAMPRRKMGVSGRSRSRPLRMGRHVRDSDCPRARPASARRSAPQVLGRLRVCRRRHEGRRMGRLSGAHGCAPHDQTTAGDLARDGSGTCGRRESISKAWSGAKMRCPALRARRNRPASLGVTAAATHAGDEPLYFLALATDHDGMLAHDRVVVPETLATFRQLENSGRRLILAIGRELPDLQRARFRRSRGRGGAAASPHAGHGQACFTTPIKDEVLPMRSPHSWPRLAEIKAALDRRRARFGKT
jgi:hypothetical protein